MSDKFDSKEASGKKEEKEELNDSIDEDINDGDEEMKGEEEEEEEEFEISNAGGQNAEDDEFDSIVGALQEIVSGKEFQDMVDSFTRKNCNVFEDSEENKLEYTSLFQEYTKHLETYIEKQLQSLVPGFSIEKFSSLLKTRKDQIDEQLLELLSSFSDFQLFKEIMLSHKKSLEAQELEKAHKKKEAEELAKSKAKEELAKSKAKEESAKAKEKSAKEKSAKEKSAKEKSAKEQSSKATKGEKQVKESQEDLGGFLGISGKKSVIHKDEQSEGEEMPDLNLNIISVNPKKK